jgi:hypothetical protein
MISVSPRPLSVAQALRSISIVARPARSIRVTAEKSFDQLIVSTIMRSEAVPPACAEPKTILRA